MAVRVTRSIGVYRRGWFPRKDRRLPVLGEAPPVTSIEAEIISGISYIDQVRAGESYIDQVQASVSYIDQVNEATIER